MPQTDITALTTHVIGFLTFFGVGYFFFSVTVLRSILLVQKINSLKVLQI